MEVLSFCLILRSRFLVGHHAVGLVDQDVAAVAIVDDALGRRRISGNDDRAVRRFEAVTIRLDVAVLDWKRRHGDVRVLVNNSRLYFVRVYLISFIVRVPLVRFEYVLGHFCESGWTIYFELLQYAGRGLRRTEYKVGIAHRVIYMAVCEKGHSDIRWI